MTLEDACTQFLAAHDAREVALAEYERALAAKRVELNLDRIEQRYKQTMAQVEALLADGSVVHMNGRCINRSNHFGGLEVDDVIGY